jgi:hypothetical protein
MNTALPSVTEADTVFDADRLRRELAVEVKRLDILLWKYFRLAADAPNGNFDAATIYVKLAARKSTLIGLDATPQHSMSIIVHRTEERRQTSTERLREAVDRIRHKALQPPDEPS